MKKILPALFPVVALLALSTAPPAHAAYTGNAIRNAVEPSLYKITVSPNTAMTSSVAIWPQHVSGSYVVCFIPALTSHSAWGGIYWGGQKRCFNTYNNGTLTLYSGMP